MKCSARFIRTGSTDPRSLIHFHLFNAETQFSLICWFWKYPPAVFFFSGMKCYYVTQTRSFIVMFLLRFLSWCLLKAIEEKEKEFYRQNLKQRYTQLFSTSKIWRNKTIKLNSKTSSSDLTNIILEINTVRQQQTS